MDRIQFWVSKEDKNLLQTLIPDHGFVTFLCTCFIKVISDDFRKAGLKYYDPTNPGFREQVNAVIKARLDGTKPQAPEHAAEEAGESSVERDDSGRKNRRGKTPPRTAKQFSSDDSTDRVGRGLGRRGPQAVKG